MSNPTDPSLEPQSDQPQNSEPPAPQPPSYSAPLADPVPPTYSAPPAPQTPSAPQVQPTPAYAAPVTPPVPPAPQAPPAPGYAPPPAPPVQNYAAPQQYGAVPAAPPTNTLAIISMISSIIGILSYGILSIAGIILGHIAMKQIKQRGEGGRGMAMTGLIVGYVGIGIYVLLTIGLIIFFVSIAAVSSSYSY